MAYEKSKKRYLTEEESIEFTKKLKSKGFAFTRISSKIFKDKSKDRDTRRATLTAVLRRKHKVTPEEFERLKSYANCWILSDDTFHQLMEENQKYQAVANVIFNYELTPKDEDNEQTVEQTK